MAKSGQKTCFDAGKIGFCHGDGDRKGKEKKRGKEKEKRKKYNLISGTYNKFAGKINFLALGVYCHATPPHLNSCKLGVILMFLTPLSEVTHKHS